MGLTSYRQKRNFKESPEPTGGKADSEKLRFVIQKHDASHLHYDFRLEMKGVLKSWAVPKGPSTDPAVKRLAMMVEDHPYDYRNFEGIIPSGYGAGTVIVWDEGFYELSGSEHKSKSVQTKELLAGLKKGKLHITLKGKKVKGEYGLIKVHGRGENGWLLFKVKDKYASENDITLKDKSVLSKKTLAQVEKTTDNFYGSKRVKESKVVSKKEIALNTHKRVKAASDKNKIEKELQTSAKKKAVKKTASRSTAKKKNPDTIAVVDVLLGAKAKTFQKKMIPMLTTLVDKPSEEAGWLYEVKWDGYRAMAFMNKGKVELKSRNDKSFNTKFYPVTEALTQLNINAIVDGEVVVLGEDGVSKFGDLQNWRSEADGALVFYAFDIVWYDGKDLTQLPLTERRVVLSSLIPNTGIIRMSEAFDENGTTFFEAAKRMGLEGIIAKKANSLYYPSLRGEEWLKIKIHKRQEVVIGGYTKNEDTSKPFSSLLVGVFEKGKLIYTGKIGTGFSINMQKEMLEKFKPLITSKIPFASEPDINKATRFRPNPPHAEAIWLKPQLICEVSFTEMTSDGVMRHPSFEGMRIDKNAKDVVLEKAKPVKQVTRKTVTSKLIAPPAKGDRKTLLNPTDETQLRKINGHEIKFTNLNKKYWPKEHITKRDLLNYYYQVAPYILPYLKNRPHSLNRHPNGIAGKNFYQKDVTGKVPEWIETFLYHSSDDTKDKHFLVCTNEASLLYMASLGCIEMNPWLSRVETPDHPDWCLIDLDPDKQSFDKVVEAANVTKSILDSMKVPSYCKTSGSTGLHIYIPLAAKYTYEQSKEFARAIVTMVQQEIPAYTTIERTIKDRKGKMYLDFLQNRPQATIATVYSVRPKPGATVSMPLHWEEVKKGLKISDFTLRNALDRIKQEGDIFKPVMGKGIDLKKILAQFK